MKKIIKNLALAILPIAGILVSSCQIEDISTTFEPKDAVATIVVTAKDAQHGNADVSADPALKLTASSTANCSISVDGNKIIIKGNPSIQEQVVTIDAEYNGVHGSGTVNVHSCLAGGNVTYPTTVIIGSAPIAVATATVQVAVWDNVSGKDVTADATYSYSGVPSSCSIEGDKGSYVITGVDGISAFNFEVTATYGGNSNKATVKIDNIARSETKAYKASIAVGTAPEPVKTPAVAKILVTAFDALLDKDVTSESVVSAQLATGSKASVEVSGNVVKVTGDNEELKIAAQKVLVTVKYNNREETAEVNLSEIPAGETVPYSVNVIFENTQVIATAVVQASVWDNATGTDVTASAKYSYKGVPEGYTVKEGDAKGSYVITSTSGIKAFDFVITAEYFEESASKTVEIGDIASETKTYTVALAVGTAPEPVKEPAVAKIHVTVIDGLLAEDITGESEITAKLPKDSEATVAVKDGVVTVTAGKNLKIAAQTVSITAKYEDLEETVDVELSEIAEGVVVDGLTQTIILQNPAKYYPVKVSETTEVTFGEFFSTHNLHLYTHDYSHELTHDYGHGHVSGNWLYNETEFILETTIEYDNMFGTKGMDVDLSKAETSADQAMVLYYSEALQSPWVVEKATLNVKVSAFARYSAFGTKITTTIVYDVLRVEPGKDDVAVGTITLTNIATQAEYVEAAIPGHEGHYTHGHGHADDHGYSSNAGGGIMWDE